MRHDTSVRGEGGVERDVPLASAVCKGKRITTRSDEQRLDRAGSTANERWSDSPRATREATAASTGVFER